VKVPGRLEDQRRQEQQEDRVDEILLRSPRPERQRHHEQRDDVRYPYPLGRDADQQGRTEDDDGFEHGAFDVHARV
jgi:hypothetical protein